MTCSIQSTTLPSWRLPGWRCKVKCGKRRCAVPVLLARREPDDVAGTYLLDRPALALARPAPEVTISVWPSGWVCQAVRAPGSKVTCAPCTRSGAAGLKSPSIRTRPVNHSAGPCRDGVSPARKISITVLLVCPYEGWWLTRWCDQGLPGFGAVMADELPVTDLATVHVDLVGDLHEPSPGPGSLVPTSPLAADLRASWAVGRKRISLMLTSSGSLMAKATSGRGFRPERRPGRHSPGSPSARRPR